VSQIVSGEHPVPLHHAVTIERETAGAVTVEELRPDIDWQVIRGLPQDKRAAA
jgi:DNA-binding transcriptional regulator YdaS (Cro superfamily)